MDKQTQSLVTVANLPTVALLEPIGINDTVHSWLNMLNRVVAICNIVDHPSDDLANRTPANIFGFMTSTDKLYLDGIKYGIHPNGVVPFDVDTTQDNFVDADVRRIKSYNAIKKATNRAVNASSSSSNGTVTVKYDSIDVQCIDASSNVLLSLIAYPDSTWYSEKLVSINAVNTVHVQYSGNDFSFVNNSIYPNVEWSSAGTPVSTLLLAGTFIVYRLTFIHSKILVEVVENTQIIDNYKAASAKAADSSLNGELAYDASASTLNSLTELANRKNVQTLYLNKDGVVGTSFVASRCASSFEMNAVVGSNAQWTSFQLKCRPNSGSALVESPAIQLQEGRHMVQMWTNDRSMVVKIDYALNKGAKMVSILGFSVIKMYSGRVYDE